MNRVGGLAQIGVSFGKKGFLFQRVFKSNILSTFNTIHVLLAKPDASVLPLHSNLKNMYFA